MKRLIFVLIFVFCSVFLKAGGLADFVGVSKYKIVENKGYNYTDGKSDYGQYYITYTISGSDAGSDGFWTTTFYFNGDNICTTVLLVTTISNINTTIKSLNELYVKTDNMTWSDYETNVSILLKYFNDKSMFSVRYDKIQ